MGKRTVRWNCEHAKDGKKCISNDACRQKRRRLKVASAAAPVAADLEKACAVTSVAAAVVGLCLAALLFRERPAITPVKSGFAIADFRSWLSSEVTQAEEDGVAYAENLWGLVVPELRGACKEFHLAKAHFFALPAEQRAQMTANMYFIRFWSGLSPAQWGFPVPRGKIPKIQ